MSHVESGIIQYRLSQESWPTLRAFKTNRVVSRFCKFRKNIICFFLLLGNSRQLGSIIRHNLCNACLIQGKDRPMYHLNWCFEPKLLKSKSPTPRVILAVRGEIKHILWCLMLWSGKDATFALNPLQKYETMSHWVMLFTTLIVLK